MGETIKSQSTKDEVVFMNVKPTPQVVYYAGRNIREVASKEDAIAFLKERKMQKGAFYTVGLSKFTFSKQPILVEKISNP